MAEAARGTRITIGAAGGITVDPVVATTRERGIGGKPRCC